MKSSIKSKSLLLFALFIGRTTAGNDVAAKAPSQEMIVARQTGWQVVQLITQRLEDKDFRPLPGTIAWLKDFHAVSGGIDAKVSPDRWPTIDADKLVTNNPNFWQAYYEIAPADPGLMLLHAGLLLYGGESTRASYIVAIAKQRPGIPKEFQKALDLLIGQTQRVIKPSNTLVHEGVTLHDQGDYKRALKKYQEALSVWPQNGLAYYESGFTLMMQRGGGPEHSKDTVDAFANARRHDPFQTAAYQGSNQDLIHGMMSLVKDGMPVWKKMTENSDKMVEDESVQQFAQACQDAGIHDLALALRQVLVARRGRYDPSDHPFITTSLHKLAPGVPTETALKQLAGQSMEARQLVEIDPVMKTYKPESGQPPRKTGAFIFDSFLFYQDTNLTGARLGNKVEPLGDYIKLIESKSIEYWAAQPRGNPQSMLIAIMLKPGNRTRFWFTFSRGGISADVIEGLRKKITSIPVPDVHGGPVATAMNCSLWDAPAITEQLPSEAVLFPEEWQRIARQNQFKLKIPISDEPFKAIWPD
jgi:tetratricopeptide (TPR) repeat protein